MKIYASLLGFYLLAMVAHSQVVQPSGGGGLSFNTFASSPTPTLNASYIFTDASSTGACTGGGTALAICVGNGTGWSATSGTSTGLGDPGSNSVPYRNGSGTTIPATATQLSGPNFCSDAGATDTYACNLSPAIASYVAGTAYWFKANTANTGASSINFNAKGALAIKVMVGSITSDTVTGDILAGQLVGCIYDGTNCEMFTQRSSQVDTTSTQTLTNKTIDGVSPSTMAFVDPTSSVQTQLNAKQGNLTLTTTGTSGAATLVGSTLNIPQYTGGGMAIGGAVTSGTPGDILIVGAGPVLAQEATLGAARFPALTGDVTTPGGSLAATVKGVNGVPLCTGFTPTNGQALEYTTASSPNPCYTAAAPGGSVTWQSGGSTIVTGNTANAVNGIAISNVGGVATIAPVTSVLQTITNFQQGNNNVAFSTNGTTGYVGSPSNGCGSTALTAGMVFWGQVDTQSTSTASWNYCSLGVISVKKADHTTDPGSGALGSGGVPANVPVPFTLYCPSGICTTLASDAWVLQPEFNTAGTGGTGNAANVVTTTFSATPTFTCPSASAGTTTVFELSTALTANITSSTLATCTSGQNLDFVFTQDATGGRTVAMPTGFDALTVSPTASITTKASYAWDGTHGYLKSVTSSDTPGLIYMPERAAYGTPAASFAACWPDSTDHAGLECKANNSANVFMSVPRPSAAGTLPNSTAAGVISQTATPTLGASGTLGSVTMGNATSGTLTVQPVTGALGTTTVLVPVAVGNGILGQTIASGTAALGTSAISSGACATVVTVSATGVATTDVIVYTPNTDPTAVTGYAASATGSLYIWAYPTANNVNFKVCNNTSGSITPSALTLNWRVGR